VLAVATIVLARHWMRRLGQRAQAAYPDPDREDTGAGHDRVLSGQGRAFALRGDD
jgi:hypothetical protein